MQSSTIDELVFEVDRHEQASHLLTAETARLAREVFVGGLPSSTVRTVGAERCHWDGHHRQNVDQLHLAWRNVVDIMSKSTRVAALCLVAVAEIMEHQRSAPGAAVRTALIQARCLTGSPPWGCG